MPWILHARDLSKTFFVFHGSFPPSKRELSRIHCLIFQTPIFTYNYMDFLVISSSLFSDFLWRKACVSFLRQTPTKGKDQNTCCLPLSFSLSCKFIFFLFYNIALVIFQLIKFHVLSPPIF